MKAATATGILFLPNAFRRTGYVMSIICGLLIGLIYTHNSVVLVQCAQELCRRHRLPKLDFAETVEVSFLMGPERTRRHGYRICYKNYIGRTSLRDNILSNLLFDDSRA
ncbi:PREDICTED: proton-coupled amino acid transporter 1-like [Polistes canadensis]|uniref:proton-coupled amino acid transporter 1-like n=1 Tax=Polistes canadensis TaxID=91411 RepID=UPI000718F4C4|nr:PREDICTED: proton-coupled amino acid transporter 1-like [Polistes canadensis]